MDDDKTPAVKALIDDIMSDAPPSPEEMAEKQRAEQAQADKAAAEDQMEQEARQWSAIPLMIGGALCMAAPELRQVYTEGNCLNWGRAMVPVSQKYGWGGARKLPELSLAIVTLSLALPSFLAVRAAVEEQRAGWVGKLRAWWLRRKAAKAEQTAEAATGVGDGR